MKIDFHVHTQYSIDGLNKPKELIAKSKKLGIIPAITDHDSTEAHKFFKKGTFIPGEEITTDIGDLCALCINDLIPKKTPFLEALDKIKEQGGISYLPHGFDQIRCNIGNKFPNYAKKVDVIEIFNARCTDNKYNLDAKSFAKKNKKLMGAGSDSHFIFEFGNTHVEMPELDVNNSKQILKYLKNAKIHGKKAPIYVRGSTLMLKFLRKIKRLF